MADMPISDLSKVISHEPSQEWPDKIEIVAHWGNRRRRFEITADEFYGRNGAGAPMSGDRLIASVHSLARQGPKLR